MDIFKLIRNTDLFVLQNRNNKCVASYHISMTTISSDFFISQLTTSIFLFIRRLCTLDGQCHLIRYLNISYNCNVNSMKNSWVIDAFVVYHRHIWNDNSNKGPCLWEEVPFRFFKPMIQWHFVVIVILQMKVIQCYHFRSQISDLPAEFTVHDLFPLSVFCCCLCYSKTGWWPCWK